MAEFITDTKKKIQEPGKDQGSRSIDVPPEENQEPASDVPTGNAQGQGPIIGQGDDAKGQGLVIIEESVGNSKEQEQEEEEEDSDYNPEDRANFSRPPGKRSAPKPKTG